MKILFYMEIHPIRGEYLSHDWIINKIINTNKKEYLKNIKIICNHKLKEKFNNSNLILELTPEEKIKIELFYKKIDINNYVEDWKDLMGANNDVYNAFYKSILDRVYNEFKFDALVYWGNSKIIKNFCINKKIPAIFSELGPTREPNFKPTIYLDLKGVNGESSLEGYSFDNIKNKITSLDCDIMINELSHKLNYCSYIEDTKLNKIIHTNWGKNILVPLQLDDDSNILMYSKYPSVLDFVKEITNKFKNTDYFLYILPHPAKKAREYNNARHEEIKNYIQSLSNCVWVEELKCEDIADKCNYIIAINSSLAFEQMLRGKIVINEGKSCWNIEEVFPKVEDIIDNNFNYKEYKNKINKLCSFILEYYLIPEHKFFELKKLKEILIKFFIKTKIQKYNDLFVIPLNNPTDYLNIHNNIKLKLPNINNDFNLIYNSESGSNILGNIARGRLIEQELKVNENNFNSIEVMVATYARDYSETLSVYLLEKETKEEVAKKIFNKDEIKDNCWIKMDFDPIKNSQNKNYVLRILNEEKQPKGSITLYYSPYINHLGNLSINGKKTDGLLNMRLFKSLN